MHVRTSSQAPFQTKAKLVYLFGMYPERFTFTPSAWGWIRRQARDVV
jgi:hypothetical protein